jgi:hypothetical protein
MSSCLGFAGYWRQAIQAWEFWPGRVLCPVSSHSYTS